jgi:hypothetical protein
MTLVGKYAQALSNCYLYYTINPTTGANNISVSKTTGAYIIIRGVLYTGCKQSGVPDAYSTAGSVSANSQAISNTSVANNCWHIVAATSQRAVSSANANVVYRIGSANAQFEIFDTDGPKSAGSLTATINEIGGPNLISLVMASFAPAQAPAATGTSPHWFLLSKSNVATTQAIDQGNLPKENGPYTWSQAHDAASADYVSTNSNHVQCDQYIGFQISRYLANFDTAYLNGRTITSAKFRIQAKDRSIDNNSRLGNLKIGLYGTTASDSLVVGDYSKCGTTAYSDSFNGGYAGFTADAWQEWPLNAAGLAAINKTGITKVCIRDYDYDVLNIQYNAAPTVNWIGYYNAPQLVVVYS